MESCLVETALMHTDGRTDRRMGRRTDMTNIIGAFRDFTKHLSRKAWNCKLRQFKEIFLQYFCPWPVNTKSNWRWDPNNTSAYPEPNLNPQCLSTDLKVLGTHIWVAILDLGIHYLRGKPIFSSVMPFCFWSIHLNFDISPLVDD
jgi:hypothetical protein